MHSGHIGDIINILPIVKELAKTHVCVLYINIDKPLDVYHHRHQAGNVYLNKKIFEYRFTILNYVFCLIIFLQIYSLLSIGTFLTL